MLIGGRNMTGLTADEIEQCVRAWEFLCGDTQRRIETSQAHVYGSSTRFDEVTDTVYLGADVFPGEWPLANARMSMLACLAHELAHAERFEMEFGRPLGSLIDEAETSLHASQMSVLGSRDREDLVEDARDRTIEWLAQQSRGES